MDEFKTALLVGGVIGTIVLSIVLTITYYNINYLKYEETVQDTKLKIFEKGGMIIPTYGNNYIVLNKKELCETYD